MIEVIVRDHRFTFSEEKALFWPKHSLLAIADLHLGKAESFQQNGLLLPSQANQEDLSRLERLVNEFDADQVLILGDFVHTAKGISERLRMQTAEFISRLNAECKVLVGNHDQKIAKNWPEEWSKIELLDEWYEDGFLFTHEPKESSTDKFTWSGHIHPMFTMSYGPDRLRLPCFVVSETQGLLPAFSSLAGGYNIQASRKTRIFPIAETAVIEL